MKKHNLILSLLTIIMVSTMIACSPSTKIVGSWKSPEIGDKKYNDLFILALTDNFINRKTFEEDFSEILAGKGIKSLSSVNVLDPGTKMQNINEDQIAAIIQKEGADGVITMGVIDQTSETRYVQGSAYPTGGYRFRGYYGYYGGMAYSPGYYTTDKSYFIEIKLFDVKSGDMIWSAQSEITNPGNLESTAMTFSRVVVERMMEDGVLPTN
ncbi:hypothetical protein SAMN00777080_4938 [Aquiflexum balticum DSM 16537]|uniref:DUF4136 domain-containing protein n=1 Tax=Aquiflexum balticum DSM 16537 TaxID=758820 RepID=A0A1W2HBM3_9BACT|nr:hypothetical protein [Aquiflexum balticum]SMD46257.1 hypothetical protein SAMN00777080_4938 [Aquiflexum balticum DSM 16537]